MEGVNPKITAIVLTKNEQDRIDDCLASLSWVDELIVIDNGSTDETRKRAVKHGARVVSGKENDFARLRNIGKDAARGEWLLYVDADERVTTELRKEIRRVTDEYKKGDEPSSYYIKRENYYLGRIWPTQDTMQRLFLKKSLVRWTGRLHETAEIDGTIGTLRHPFIHDTHRSLEEMVDKTNAWSEIEASLRFDASHPAVSWWRLLRVMMTGFYTSFFHQGGWRAGTRGLIESIFQAYSMFITYAKLWEMQQKKQLIIDN